MRRRNWQEIIVDGMQSQDGKRLWFVTKTLRDRIAKNEGMDLQDVPRSLSAYFAILIKNGIVERAFKPKGIEKRYNAQQEYIYRLTGKPFKAQPRGAKLAAKNKYVTQESIDLGYDLWVKYKHLPKWFRNMMK